jgi:hypothetical protein
MFIGIDYSPQCVALVSFIHGRYEARTILYDGAGPMVEERPDPHWHIIIYHAAKSPNSIQHYENVKQFVMTQVQAFIDFHNDERESAPCIGIEDNLHSFVGSSQFTQMAEMKAVIALACHEQHWEYYVINVSTARAIWIRRPLPHGPRGQNLRDAWYQYKEQPIKRKLHTLFRIREGFRFRTVNRPYHDIIDAYVQFHAVSTRPAQIDRADKYANRPLRAFLRV